MAPLRPCDACLRHVRADVTRCPFCDQALAIAATHVERTPRLGRAARMAFGAAVATASIAAACGGGNKPAETSGTNTAEAGPPADDAAPATSASIDPNMAKPYGAPPADGLLV